MLGKIMRKMLLASVTLAILGLILPDHGSAQALSNEGSGLLPTESDMPGYVLRDQDQGYWMVGEDQLRKCIRQNWSDVRDEGGIAVGICLFDSEIEAQNGTSYEREHIAQHLWWGSFSGPIIGEKSWMEIVGSQEPIRAVLLFVQGNVGVKIGTYMARKEILQLITDVAVKILQRIQDSYPAQVPEALKEKQVSEQEYGDRVRRLTQSILRDHTHTDEKDSKWVLSDREYVPGRYREWVAQGKVTGIDICAFDSPGMARQAAEIRSREADAPILYEPIGEISSPFWDMRTGIVMTGSVILVKGSRAIHLYQFDREGISPGLFRQLAENLD